MLALVLTLLACGGGSDPSAPPAAPVAEAVVPALPPQVARAVELARAVQADPANADAALAAKGASRAELDALLYTIAADPALTDLYAKELGF